MEGAAVPAAPAAGVNAAGAGTRSISFSVSVLAPALGAAPSISRPIEPGALLPGPAAAEPTAFAVAARSQAVPNAVLPAPAAAAAVAFAGTALASGAGPVAAISRPKNARETAAIVDIERGTSDWIARAPQELDAAPAAAAPREAGALDRSSNRAPAERSAPATPSPGGSTPSPSKLKTVLSWAAPILALTAAVASADAGSKLFAASHLFTIFHEAAWRTPLLMAIIPYLALTALLARAGLSSGKFLQWSPKKIGNGRLGFFRDELSGIGAMTQDHPSLLRLVRLYDGAIALMMGGALGNGIDALRLGGALDWIPVGRSFMNLADFAILFGLAFVQLGTSFFIKAAKAHKSGKPLRFSTVWFLGLPLAGVFAAWAFGTTGTAGALELVMKHIGYVYLMGLSMLLGISRFLVAIVMDRFVSRFVAEEGEKAAARRA